MFSPSISTQIYKVLSLGKTGAHFTWRQLFQLALMFKWAAKSRKWVNWLKLQHYTHNLRKLFFSSCCHFVRIVFFKFFSTVNRSLFKPKINVLALILLIWHYMHWKRVSYFTQSFVYFEKNLHWYSPRWCKISNVVTGHKFQHLSRWKTCSVLNQLYLLYQKCI